MPTLYCKKKIILTSILIFHSYEEVDEYSMPTITVWMLISVFFF